MPVCTPNGKSLKFKRDTGMCYGFPYLDLQETHDLEGLVCVQTMRKNFESVTKGELKKAILTRQESLFQLPLCEAFGVLSHGLDTGQP